MDAVEPAGVAQPGGEEPPPPQQKPNGPPHFGMGATIGIGAGIGIALGSVIGNLTAGLAMGAGLVSSPAPFSSPAVAAERSRGATGGSSRRCGCGCRSNPCW